MDLSNPIFLWIVVYINSLVPFPIYIRERAVEMTVVVGPTFRSIFATVCQYFYCCVLHKTTSFNMPPKVKAKAKVKVVAKSKATAAKNDNIETDNPIKFRLSGTGGTAKSTLNE